MKFTLQMKARTLHQIVHGEFDSFFSGNKVVLVLGHALGFILALLLEHKETIPSHLEAVRHEIEKVIWICEVVYSLFVGCPANISGAFHRATKHRCAQFDTQYIIEVTKFLLQKLCSFD